MQSSVVLIINKFRIGTKLMKRKTENRREFLSRAALAASAIPLMLSCRSDSLAQVKNEDILETLKKNAGDPGLNWTGAYDAPAGLSWKSALAGSKEEGDRLKIKGTVFKPDGKTPAPNVLIYAYHTDRGGLYGQEGEPNHGRFRGWFLTDNRGRYEFTSIKPGSYPNRRNPAHIHMTLTTVDRREFWIDSILFEGDPLITSDMRQIKRGGFNPILKLQKDSNGILSATRNIQL